MSQAISYLQAVLHFHIFSMYFLLNPNDYFLLVQIHFIVLLLQKILNKYLPDAREQFKHFIYINWFNHIRLLLTEESEAQLE